MPRMLWASAAALALVGCARGGRSAELVVEEAEWVGARATAVRREVSQGEALFHRRWRPGDPRAGDDGLGPLYNDVSCVGCHSQGGPGGAGPAEKNAELLVRQGQVRLLHKASTSEDYVALRASALMGAPVLLGPDAHTSAVRRRGALRVDVVERNTPALFGEGLLDEISAGELLLLADLQRRAGEVSGRVARTPDGDVGRFGWKGDVASLGEFVAQACANELGLSTDDHLQASLDVAAEPSRPDLDREQLAAIRAYVRTLPRPTEEEPADLVHPGEDLFYRVGCDDCHVEDVGDVERVFSDLLLHDMGRELSDGQVRAGAYGQRAGEAQARSAVGMAAPSEWRTPPLWGVADSGPWMHDGRASTLERAIQLHDGEGRAAKGRFYYLPDEDQAQIIAFLETLKAPGPERPPG